MSCCRRPRKEPRAESFYSALNCWIQLQPLQTCPLRLESLSLWPYLLQSSFNEFYPLPKLSLRAFRTIEKFFSCFTLRFANGILGLQPDSALIAIYESDPLLIHTIIPFPCDVPAPDPAPGAAVPVTESPVNMELKSQMENCSTMVSSIA